MLITSELFYLGMFYFLAVVGVGSACVVAFSRDLARAIFMLLFALGSIAGFYLWFGADFLSMVQILIYVGGILVILIFAMMISQHFPIEEEDLDLSKNVSAFTISALFLAGAIGTAISTAWPEASLLEAMPTTSRLGRPLLSNYLFPFELAGLILLVALIGATMLTRNEDESSRHDNIAYDREREE